ncbi:hypothetical protein [Cyanothece sp. BG0011]|uniref:hypothetical protein n=1 Tax=Cyanothece sp. BG0011 TaxID=2082950 RepID=UPI000D1E0718|nr:hypothetical protein [Cyanothece sp. BG0011]
MHKLVASLTILTGTSVSLLMGTTSALAASFNWSYETGVGNIFTGMLDGEVQEDGNTINVTSVSMNQLNGINLPSTPIIRNSEGLLNSTGIVSFDGTIMNLGACETTDCLTGIFIGNLGIFSNTVLSTSPEFGDGFDDPFEPSRWNIAEKPKVPEPSLTLALVSLGLSGIIKTSLKKR